MTQDEFLAWVKKLERMQDELDSMQEMIIRELGEHKRMQLKVLEAIAKSNKLMDRADQLDIARLLSRKGGAC